MNNMAHQRENKSTAQFISTRRIHFLLLAIIHQALSTSLPSSRPFQLSQLIKQRCDDRLAVWIYEGTLSDHDTGRIVADVEGVELVGALQRIDAGSDESDDSRWLNNLSVRKILSCADEWDTANTILSRKLFCYKRRDGCNENINNGSDNKEAGELLTSIRLRPDGPLRHLSPSESTSVYDSAITFIVRGKDLTVISERGANTNETGDKRKPIIIGTVQPSEMSEDDFEYTIYARKTTEQPRLPPLRSKGEMTISPQRSRLIQFGKSEETGRKYDAVRETYVYSLGNMQQTSAGDIDTESKSKWFKRFQKEQSTSPTTKQHIVRYTRYGEAPPWYAPGRMCTLDLIGKRVDIPQISDDETSLTSIKLPPLIKWSVNKCTPSFSSGWPSQMLSRKNDVVSDAKAMELFCTENPRCIIYDVDRNQSRTWKRAEHFLSTLQKSGERLKGSLLCDGAQ